ncbi:MAG: recombinase family protein [Flavonifractor plautii]
MEHALRVAAYCRVSTDKEDQLHSLAAQQAYFEGYIARHGWRCAGIFADEGLSGTTLRRPRFAELLRLARSGAVDLILTKEVSRFARNTVDALQVTRRLREQGVGVIFLSDGIDTRDNDGEFRLTIMASVAQEESRKISERTRWGQPRPCGGGWPSATTRCTAMRCGAGRSPSGRNRRRWCGRCTASVWRRVKGPTPLPGSSPRRGWPRPSGRTGRGRPP